MLFNEVHSLNVRFAHLVGEQNFLFCACRAQKGFSVIPKGTGLKLIVVLILLFQLQILRNLNEVGHFAVSFIVNFTQTFKPNTFWDFDKVYILIVQAHCFPMVDTLAELNNFGAIIR